MAERWLQNIHLRWGVLSTWGRLLFWLLWLRPFEMKTERAIITRLKNHFSSHGIPNLFQRDNRPPFGSPEFRFSSRKFTNSPNYPQSNGRVENAVKTAKKLMKNSKQAGTDFYFPLPDRRNTPTEGVGNSWVQRRGRRKIMIFPTASSLLKPKTPSVVRRKSVRPLITIKALENCCLFTRNNINLQLHHTVQK